MTALVAVAARQTGAAPPDDPIHLTAYLVGREYDYWGRLRAAGRIITDDRALMRTVLAATLAGPPPEVEAAGLLHAAGVADTLAAAESLADDHAVCYPAREPRSLLQRTGEEALGIERRLAAADPATYTVPVARTPILAAAGYCQLERYEEAEPHCREAVALPRRMMVVNPSMATPDLARPLTRPAIVCGRVGRLDDALAAAREATALLHTSAEQVPGLYAFGVPMAAELLATLLDMAGRSDEAAEVRRAQGI
jgi:hypothetical protein